MSLRVFAQLGSHTLLSFTPKSAFFTQHLPRRDCALGFVIACSLSSTTQKLRKALSDEHFQMLFYHRNLGDNKAQAKTPSVESILRPATSMKEGSKVYGDAFCRRVG